MQGRSLPELSRAQASVWRQSGSAPLVYSTAMMSEAGALLQRSSGRLSRSLLAAAPASFRDAASLPGERADAVQHIAPRHARGAGARLDRQSDRRRRSTDQSGDDV